MTTLKINITRTELGKNFPLPQPATDGSAGLDLYWVDGPTVYLVPGERRAVYTGISIAVPPGYEAQIRARSGLAHRKGLALANGVGTIDSDYRGEIIVLLINLGKEDIHFKEGERIAQLVVAPVMQVSWIETDILTTTTRGEGGVGSTGETDD